jgi:Predicted permease
MKDPAKQSEMLQIRNVLFFMAVLMTLYVFKLASTVVIPIVIAFFCFVILSPLMNRMDRIKIPFALTVVFGLLIVVAVFVAFVYTIVLMANTLMVGIPNYVDRVSSLDSEVSAYLIEFFDFPANFSIIKSLNIDWYGLAMTSLQSISGRIVTFFSKGMLILVFLLFLLIERKSFLPKIQAAYSDENDSQRPVILMSKMNKQISRYLIVKLCLSAATGICFYSSAVLMGLDFAIVWGILAFVLNFIPTIGSIVITVMTILMAIIQFMPNPSPIIGVALINITIEMVIGNILDPKIQGEHLNLSPVALLISLSIWGYIWGIVGMFLAVPLTGILQIVLANIPSTRKFAIMLSGGSAYVRDSRTRVKKKNDKPGMPDIILPEKSGKH